MMDTFVEGSREGFDSTDRVLNVGCLGTKETTSKSKWNRDAEPEQEEHNEQGNWDCPGALAAPQQEI